MEMEGFRLHYVNEAFLRYMLSVILLLKDYID